MIKLLVISLEEPEQEIYDKIIEIVNAAHISIDETIEGKQEKIKNGDLIILPDQHKVLKENQEISLTNIEFHILYVLALHQGITLPKEKIYNFVRNGEYLKDDSNVTSHFRRLRKKIGDNPSRSEYIQTVHGIGCKMNRIKKK